MHILIAPNAFKNSLSAEEVATAIQKGLQNSSLSCSLECFPVGDGGDGTAQLIIEKFKGAKVNIKVHDPLKRIVDTSFGLIDGGATAVIEMADASGIGLLQLHELNPLKASSFGTGEMILAALDKSVSKIIIGLGGSATVDGGIGMLSAMGVKFLDHNGNLLPPIPDQLSQLAEIDISALDSRIANCKITVLCDVDNYLLGINGSAAVFGPQKGAKTEDVDKLDALLANLSRLCFNETGKRMDQVKHGGAAGGVAAALFAFCNAELVAGAEHFLQITNFKESLSKCDLVITGEGRLDVQTLQGKAPFAVAEMAKDNKIPVVGVAGRVPIQKNSVLNNHFDILLAIGNEPSELSQAITDTKENLVRTGTLIGNLISISQKK